MMPDERTCRICGCIDADACMTRVTLPSGAVHDRPCQWVGDDLCSACKLSKNEIKLSGPNKDHRPLAPENEGERVNVSSGYGARTKRPFVAVQIGDRKPYQWSPDEARRVAVLLIECAEAADGDAFVVDWFTEQAGLAMPQIAPLLADFRASRERIRDGE